MAAITSAQAKAIMSSPRAKARVMVQNCIGLEPFDDENDLGNSILVDFLYNTAKLASDKGFPWPQVALAINFSYDLLQYSLRKNITEAVKFVTAKSEGLVKHFGERNHEIFMDFVFSTFMAHYKLFQFVFTKDREIQRPQVGVTVEGPLAPVPLAGGVEGKLWEYEQKLEGIEALAKERHALRACMIEQLEKDHRQNQLHVDLKVDSLGHPITKTELKDLLEDVLAAYAKETEQELTLSILSAQDDLEFKLAATALPRPAPLGPPPRFAPKPKPDQTPSATKRHSVKTDDSRKKSGSDGRNQSRTSSKGTKA